MRQLELANFKAFDSPFVLEPEGRNMLIFGENGSGKSSIAAALRMAFHYRRMLGRFARKGVNRETELRRFLSSFTYLNGRMGAEPTVKFNGVSFLEQIPHNTHCAIITPASLNPEDLRAGEVSPYKPDTINYRRIAAATDYVFWDDDEAPDAIDRLQQVVQEVNALLETRFYERFRIGIATDDMYIYLKDEVTGLYASEDLHKYFNEAKINLAVLLLLLVTIKREYALHGSDDSHNILVIDDVVTSLDACNRTFVVEYLLSEFSSYQLVMLTHNIGFNNTFLTMVKEAGRGAQWQSLTLYVKAGSPQAYEYEAFRSCKELLADITGNQGQHSDNRLLAIEVRRHFEALLIEFAKFTLLDARERANFFMKRLKAGNRPFFLRMHDGKPEYADDLVGDIMKVIDGSGTPADKIAAIKNKMECWSSSTDMSRLMEIANKLNMYEKLFAHGATHGGKPLTVIYHHELKAAAVLLCEMEKTIHYYKSHIGDM